MKDFRSLNVWEKGHTITLSIYKLTQSFPKEEMYGLTSQIRRASTSIPTNIAEGCGRGSDADFARFLQMSFVPQMKQSICYFCALNWDTSLKKTILN
ncbi:MAG TPA: four helix bundle protein [Lutibacter sp.]